MSRSASQQRLLGSAASRAVTGCNLWICAEATGSGTTPWPWTNLTPCGMGRQYRLL